MWHHLLFIKTFMLHVIGYRLQLSWPELTWLYWFSIFSSGSHWVHWCFPPEQPWFTLYGHASALFWFLRQNVVEFPALKGTVVQRQSHLPWCDQLVIDVLDGFLRVIWQADERGSKYRQENQMNWACFDVNTAVLIHSSGWYGRQICASCIADLHCPVIH